jgi:cytochrome c biogenesis protein CcdA
VIDIPAFFGFELGQLTVPTIVVGAAIDSINPCALGVLLFLMAYLVKVFRKKSMMLLGAVLYISAVYTTYFFSGVGLLTAIQNITIAYFFYWLATFVAFGAAAFEIKDFFWYGKGFSFQLLPGGAQRLEMWANAIERLSKKTPKLSLAMTVPIGFGAAAFELPCTGQVYLAILALMRSAGITTWLPLLLLYNFIFVFPLIVIAGLLYAGVSSHRLEKWRKKNRRYMRLFIGLFLYGLGGLLLWYIYNEFTFGLFIRELTFLLYASQVVILAYVIYKGFFGTP